MEEIDFISILARYVDEGTDELRCLIVKFLTCFLAESSLLSAQELESIVVRNSFFLTRWQVVYLICASGRSDAMDSVWKVYDMHSPDVNDLRATLLLRVLVVETSHLEDLLQESIAANDNWETRWTNFCFIQSDLVYSRFPRFSAATKLFQIILDVSKPSFSIEGGQWRSSVMQIFYKFFSCIWAADQVYI